MYCTDFPCDASTCTISLAPDGTGFMAGTDQANRYYATLDMAVELRGTCHAGPVHDVCFPQGCSDIFVTCSMHDIRIWNAGLRQELLRIQVPNLVCAGDWVRMGEYKHGAKGLCQERAYVSGLEAANALARNDTMTALDLSSCGLGPVAGGGLKDMLGMMQNRAIILKTDIPPSLKRATARTRFANLDHRPHASRSFSSSISF